MCDCHTQPVRSDPGYKQCHRASSPAQSSVVTPFHPTANSQLCSLLHTPTTPQPHFPKAQNLPRIVNLAAFTSTSAPSQTLLKHSHTADTSVRTPKCKTQSCEPRAPKGLCAPAMAAVASRTFHPHLILLYNIQPHSSGLSHSPSTGKPADPTQQGQSQSVLGSRPAPTKHSFSQGASTPLPQQFGCPSVYKANAQLGWMGARLPAALLRTGTAAPKPFWMLSLQPHRLAADFHQANIRIPAVCSQPSIPLFPPPHSSACIFAYHRGGRKEASLGRRGMHTLQ